MLYTPILEVTTLVFEVFLIRLGIRRRLLLQILVKAVRNKDISVTGQYVPESREYSHNSILPASSDKLP